jgi:hypothetical protein
MSSTRYVSLGMGWGERWETWDGVLMVLVV